MKAAVAVAVLTTLAASGGTAHAADRIGFTESNRAQVRVGAGVPDVSGDVAGRVAPALDVTFLDYRIVAGGGPLRVSAQLEDLGAGAADETVYRFDVRGHGRGPVYQLFASENGRAGVRDVAAKRTAFCGTSRVNYRTDTVSVTIPVRCLPQAQDTTVAVRAVTRTADASGGRDKTGYGMAIPVG